MNKLALTIATAASAVAISFAPNSRADETTTTTTTTVQPMPAQPVQPVQPMTIAPPGTTSITSSPYAPPPQGQEYYAEREVAHRPNKVLLSTGAGIFAVSYGASAIAAAASPLDADKKLFIPVVGPWIDLNERPSNVGGNEDFNKAMIITSGVAQGAGVLLALSSLIIPETTSTTEKSIVSDAKPSIHVTPVSYQAGAGVGAFGNF
jgi:hypothetical protein